MATINRDENHVLIDGEVGISDVRFIGSTLYQTIDRWGAGDVVLDFSHTTGAYPHGMLPLIALCRHYSLDGVQFSVAPPKNGQLKNLFVNANWMHLINPETYSKSTYQAERHVCAMLFEDTSGQDLAVRSIMRAMLSSMDSVCRSSLSALQWSLDEITDNVLGHSKCRFGGLVQAQTFKAHRRCVSVVVADAGIGIPASLRDGGIRLTSDSHGLEQAIKEGVTSKPKLNQGNGLFGSYQLSVLSGGRFRIESGRGMLRADRGDLKTEQEKAPIRGTTVHFVIDCSDQDLLAKALRFKGEAHAPAYDWLEAEYKENQSGNVSFSIKEHVLSLRSRDAGRAVKTQVKNILEAIGPSNNITVDFSDIPVISSSFADEVFGMLFAELGPMRFMARFRFVNVHPIVQGLIDRAIEKRVGSTVSGG